MRPPLAGQERALRPPPSGRVAPQQPDDDAESAQSQRPASSGSPNSAFVLRTALVLIALQLLFRSATISRAWFFGDDFGFLHDSIGSPLSWAYLLEPYNGHLMPGGKLLGWLGAQWGQPFPWALYGLELVALQAICGVLMLWVLWRLFGPRPGVLIGLTLYLFSALMVHTSVWWSSAMIELPAQAAGLALVGCYVSWVQSRRRWWAVLCVVALALGLFFHLRTLLYLPILPVLALGFFASGRLRDRVVLTARRDGALIGALAVLAVGYTVYYLTQVPSPATTTGVDFLGTFDQMLRDTVVPGLLGGPWHWPTFGQAAPPAFAVTAAWVVLALLYRHYYKGAATLWATALFLLHVMMASTLVALTKSAGFGADVGSSVRYAASSVLVAALAVPLALFPLRETPSPEHPNDGPAQRAPAPTPLVVKALCLVIVTGFAVSSYPGYAHPPGKDTRAYAERTLRGVEEAESDVVVADVELPDGVIDKFWFPSNFPSILFQDVPGLSAVKAGNDLGVLTQAGDIRPAEVLPGFTSSDRPANECGYAVSRRSSATVEFAGTPPEFFWWMSIPYLSGGEGTLVVTHADVVKEVRVEKGLHELFIQSAGSPAPLTLSTPDPELGLCVDKVSVGKLAPMKKGS